MDDMTSEHIIDESEEFSSDSESEDDDLLGEQVDQEMLDDLIDHETINLEREAQPQITIEQMTPSPEKIQNKLTNESPKKCLSQAQKKSIKKEIKRSGVYLTKHLSVIERHNLLIHPKSDQAKQAAHQAKLSSAVLMNPQSFEDLGD